ncbi:unnamed protein product [Ceutorhynchus assimilis]|uniref:Uncharacterized protein n=1 Tax=Ceutorhynchus assimilis TaxID=467358 RepID=A0A9P0DL28_9CUCU|nr:unnamed protein product [Ceutorhynchus assimilis]
MSGPRMGNLGQMNGNRRPNPSRMNYHESRQGSSYQDHRPAYQDHRQISHEGRHDSRPHDSRQYDHRQHENRQSFTHQQMPQPTSMNSQHDELIKYIYESWSKIELDKASNNAFYYQEHENHHLKDFRPFDLEAFWGRKVHATHQQHLS